MSSIALILTGLLRYGDPAAQRQKFYYAASLIAGEYDNGMRSFLLGYLRNQGVQ